MRVPQPDGCARDKRLGMRPPAQETGKVTYRAARRMQNEIWPTADGNSRLAALPFFGFGCLCLVVFCFFFWVDRVGRSAKKGVGWRRGIKACRGWISMCSWAPDMHARAHARRRAAATTTAAVRASWVCLTGYRAVTRGVFPFVVDGVDRKKKRHWVHVATFERYTAHRPRGWPVRARHACGSAAAIMQTTRGKLSADTAEAIFGAPSKRGNTLVFFILFDSFSKQPLFGCGPCQRVRRPPSPVSCHSRQIGCERGGWYTLLLHARLYMNCNRLLGPSPRTLLCRVGRRSH